MLSLDQLLEVCSSPLQLSDDRPYGLIQATETRDDAPAAGPAWDSQLGWPRELGLLILTHSDCREAARRVGFNTG
jgi:hypothetical protein